MAYRRVDATQVQNQHDTERINAEVNRALDQYRTTWQARKAVIITWKATSQVNILKAEDVRQLLLVYTLSFYQIFMKLCHYVCSINLSQVRICVMSVQRQGHLVK